MEDEVDHHPESLGDLVDTTVDSHDPLPLSSLPAVGEFGVLAAVADLLDAVSSLSDDTSCHVVRDDAGDLTESFSVVLGDLEKDELLGSVHGGSGVGDDGDKAEVCE